MKSNSSKALEIIEGKLYWICNPTPPKSQSSAFFFCIDDDLVYDPFVHDFGPLNLAQTHQFCAELQKLMNDEKYKKYKIYHYCRNDYKKQANGAFLMGAFQVIMLGRTAESAWSVFENYDPPFIHFRDAINGPCSYSCTILDCLKGLETAISLKWYDPNTFKVKEYEHYEKLENGDMNWIIPGKFLAFSSPASKNRDADGFPTLTPTDYLPAFKKLKIKMVIRLNHKSYNKDLFVKNGIKHADLFFPDGSCPKEEIIKNFLDVTEREKGAIAVHCQAGLGRTGTLIACYAMKHFRFTAPAFIGWIRICRPGSILGPQQHFLLGIQDILYKWGEEEADKSEQIRKEIQKLDLNDEMTAEEKIRAKSGHHGQAKDLMKAKRKK